MRKLFIAAISIIFISCNNKQSVDLIVHNATIYTVDSTFATAEAMAIKDGKIIATGTTQFILNNYEAKEIIDAEKKAVYPGFIDAHAHFVGYGQSLFVADLYDTKSFEEVIERLKSFAAEHPDEKWILGRGWDQNKWPGKTYPTNEKLNQLLTAQKTTSINEYFLAFSPMFYLLLVLRVFL